MRGNVKTIKVTVQTGSGAYSYRYKTEHFPPDSQELSEEDSAEPIIDHHSAHTLSRIMRGDLPLTSMSYENRMAWKSIMDEIEEESACQ